MSPGRTASIKKFVFWQFTLLPTYAFLWLALVVGAALEAASLGPYTAWVDQRLHRMAVQAGLVGAPESRVELVLGRADNVMRGWEPAEEGAATRATAIYEYYPYPFVPLSKFRVHCAQGRVRAVERASSPAR
jgi:hypothetical protein